MQSRTTILGIEKPCPLSRYPQDRIDSARYHAGLQQHVRRPGWAEGNQLVAASISYICRNWYISLTCAVRQVILSHITSMNSPISGSKAYPASNIHRCERSRTINRDRDRIWCFRALRVILLLSNMPHHCWNLSNGRQPSEIFDRCHCRYAIGFPLTKTWLEGQ